MFVEPEIENNLHYRFISIFMLELLEYILFISREMSPGSAEDYIGIACARYKYEKKLQSSSPSIHLLLNHVQES